MKRQTILLAIMLIAGIIIRVLAWPNTMPEINCDEAMTAINAYCIATFGQDQYGASFPVYFESWVLAGQSALLTYLMALFIKIFGVSLFSIRLPMLIISIISLFVFYDLVRRIFKNKKIALIALFLLIISPWHIIQSLWGLDCNMFPHIMLIGVWLLCIGLEKKIFMYISMIAFAISMYAYGVAYYTVPIFLLLFMWYLKKNKKVHLKEIIPCIAIFVVISLPLIIMTIVNLFNIETINLGAISIQNFEKQVRDNDMLIFSGLGFFSSLMANLKSLISVIMFQTDGMIWNAIDGFGTIYYISLIFIVISIIELYKTRKFITPALALLLAWLLTSAIVGVLINGTNINRLNVIWYPLIILAAHGIYVLLNRHYFKKWLVALVVGGYTVLAIGFVIVLHTSYPRNLENSFTWDKGLVEACHYIKQNEYNEVVFSTGTLETEKQIIFAKYVLMDEVVPDEQYKQELLKYIYREKDLKVFNNYKVEAVDKELSEDVYILTNVELDKIVNLKDYKINRFNQYVVLERGE